MKYSHVFDYSNNIISQGYIYCKSSQSDITLSSLIDSVVQNIIVYDTESFIMDEFLVAAQNILNAKDKLVIGLTSDSILKKLTDKGVKGGFFRSTSVKSKIAIIIVDKQKYYLAFDANHIYSTNSNDNALIFNYINHLIWSKSDFEFCKQRISEVKNTRLSIVKPIFDQKFDFDSLEYATKDFKSKGALKVKEDNSDEDSIVMNELTKSAFMINDVLYLQAIENSYFPVSDWDSLKKAISFKNKNYKSLKNDSLWVNNKIINIKQTDVIVKKYEMPLDSYKSFKPDFEAIAKEYNDYSLSLTIDVEVNPLRLNDKYKLSDNYKKNEEIKNILSKYFEELDKLIDDKKTKKQLTNIIQERNFEEQIRLFNMFISDKEFGVAALNTKTKFKFIDYSKKWNVPSELIGKLYTNGKEVYFALNDEKYIDDAKIWLKDNQQEAVLILGKED